MTAFDGVFESIGVVATICAGLGLVVFVASWMVHVHKKIEDMEWEIRKLKTDHDGLYMKLVHQSGLPQPPEIAK